MIIRPRQNHSRSFFLLARAIALLLLGMTAICPPMAWAEGSPQEYKVKAAYLYNFTKFVSWPSTALPETAPAITICILGKDPFDSFLAPLTRLKSQGKNLAVKRITNIDDLKNSQILFISASEQDRLQEVLRKASVLQLLTVSDMAGFAEQGGIIGFVLKDGKIRLQINLGAARKNGLEISAKLLEIATVIP